MPIYDYACSACGRVTEVIHRINDQGPRFCPNCGAEGTLRKALTAPAVVFKGSGWAKLDRRSSSGGSSSARSSTKSGATSSGSGAGSSEGRSVEARSSEARSSGADGSSGSGAKEASGGRSGTASSSDGGGD